MPSCVDAAIISNDARLQIAEIIQQAQNKSGLKQVCQEQCCLRGKIDKRFYRC